MPSRLSPTGPPREEQLDEIKGEAKGTIDEAVRFADESEQPPLEELYTDVYAGEDEYLGEA
jgi:pyruvate dehydrogenase E1 component alpha subunit